MVTHYRVTNERTGNPLVDNRARRWNKHLSRLRRQFVVHTPQGRRRKKKLTTQTYLDYLRLWLAVYDDIARKHGSP